jgi:predicted DNA-binding transcriptional regulator AlpA
MSDYLNTHKAAAFLGLSHWTLIKWRSDGRGPKYVKFGVRVRYRTADLAEYVDANLVSPAQAN